MGSQGCEHFGCFTFSVPGSRTSKACTATLAAKSITTANTTVFQRPPPAGADLPSEVGLGQHAPGAQSASADLASTHVPSRSALCPTWSLLTAISPSAALEPIIMPIARKTRWQIPLRTESVRLAPSCLGRYPRQARAGIFDPPKPAAVSKRRPVDDKNRAT